MTQWTLGWRILFITGLSDWTMVYLDEQRDPGVFRERKQIYGEIESN